jgi:hypothetical protein
MRVAGDKKPETLTKKHENPKVAPPTHQLILRSLKSSSHEKDFIFWQCLRGKNLNTLIPELY